MYKGSLVTIEDLTVSQIEDILDLAEEIEEDRDAYHGLASRLILASLFLEPSTRTRGSFESAMKRLGGDVVTTADPKSSSITKGESLADTVRIWSSYADLMVIRHPWEGAARLTAEYSDVPVINAGDGAHEHPTQTLLDLYTLRKEFGTLKGRKIVLCGDLKNGRTVHSLVYALLKFGAMIIFVPGEGLGLPDHVIHRIEAEYESPIQKIRHPGLEALYAGSDNGPREMVDAIYMTPSQPHSLTLFDSMRLQLDKDESFALYATRRQGERETQGSNGNHKAYPRIDETVLHRADFSKVFVMHPLPRVDELSPAIDADPRSRYFQQAKNGVPVRMALIALMMGLKPWSQDVLSGQGPAQELQQSGIPLQQAQDITCSNPACAVVMEPRNVTPQFIYYRQPCLRLVCSYCERESTPVFFSYPYGEVYHPLREFPRNPDGPARFGFYPDEATARASGLRQPQRTTAGV